MKTKDILLDFTSLLDIVLLILFFFILFSHMETEEKLAEADAKMNEANNVLEDAENTYEQLQEELELIQNADDRQAANLSALLEYQRGDNVKLILQMQDTDWSIHVVRAEKSIADIDKADNIGEALIAALESVGYNERSSLFCEFVYDGTESGTASAYRKVKKGIEEAKATFEYLYFSETDISIGRE